MWQEYGSGVSEDGKRKPSLLIFLGLCSLICKMAIIIVPTSEGCYEDEMNTCHALRRVSHQGYRVILELDSRSACPTSAAGRQQRVQAGRWSSAQGQTGRGASRIPPASVAARAAFSRTSSHAAAT